MFLPHFLHVGLQLLLATCMVAGHGPKVSPFTSAKDIQREAETGPQCAGYFRDHLKLRIEVPEERISVQQCLNKNAGDNVVVGMSFKKSTWDPINKKTVGRSRCAYPKIAQSDDQDNLWDYPTTRNPIAKVKASAMGRCHIVVFRQGTDDTILRPVDESGGVGSHSTGAGALSIQLQSASSQFTSADDVRKEAGHKPQCTGNFRGDPGLPIQDTGRKSKTVQQCIDLDEGDNVVVGMKFRRDSKNENKRTSYTRCAYPKIDLSNDQGDLWDQPGERARTSIPKTNVDKDKGKCCFVVFKRPAASSPSVDGVGAGRGGANSPGAGAGISSTVDTSGGGVAGHSPKAGAGMPILVGESGVGSVGSHSDIKMWSSDPWMGAPAREQSI